MSIEIQLQTLSKEPYMLQITNFTAKIFIILIMAIFVGGFVQGSSWITVGPVTGF
jgi:hypothetical protein